MRVDVDYIVYTIRRNIRSIVQDACSRRFECEPTGYTARNEELLPEAR